MNRPRPIVGNDYGYHAVANFYDPRPVGIHFVLTDGASIVALRVREGFNPEIVSSRPEIWVGATQLQRKWGDVLAGTSAALPVFVKRDGTSKYTYLGKYKVTGSTTEETQLAPVRTRVTHAYGLSRIVSLQKA